jgi:UDP-GlcNAc:undecaprenyl-phosphate GlcNAc-1-phosphate transferase
LITGLAFLIPITDTTTVTINRLLKRKSPFVGGKDHTTHHLSYAGLSDRKVVILLSVISLFSVSFSVLILNFIKNLTFVQTVLFVSFVIIVFIALYTITKITKPNKEK